MAFETIPWVGNVVDVINADVLEIDINISDLPHGVYRVRANMADAYETRGVFAQPGREARADLIANDWGPPNQLFGTADGIDQHGRLVSNLFRLCDPDGLSQFIIDSGHGVGVHAVAGATLDGINWAAIDEFFTIEFQPRLNGMTTETPLIVQAFQA